MTNCHANTIIRLLLMSVLALTTASIRAAAPTVPESDTETDLKSSLRKYFSSWQPRTEGRTPTLQSVSAELEPPTDQPLTVAPTTVKFVRIRDRLQRFMGCEPGNVSDVRANHRNGIRGEFLYLQARTVDIPFATPIDGIGETAVPIGATLFVDPTHQPGFRVGFTDNRTADSSISTDFWHYQSQSQTSGSMTGGSGFFEALLVHPNTTSVAADSLATDATFDIDFSIVDAHYRTTFHETDLCSIDLVAGARYVRIQEDLRASYSILGTTNLTTNLNFDGVGPRIGLELERPLDANRWNLFVRGYGSMLLGNVTANFTQTNALAGGTQATTSLDDSRFVPTTELEIGLNWNSANGHWNFSGGYYIATYHNALTTGRFIQGVQNHDLYKLEDDLTFSGLMTRIEVQW
ncbi:MAG TPA: hypothetical protein DCE43_17675 [Planctomycetaceae bacterium]|nr:hypothetical protein [Planctomycetaceae bacterium]